MNTYQGPGFYYHYKHDSAKGLRDYAYEVLNIAHHTEMEDFHGTGRMVVYRPLRESAKIYQDGQHWYVRPYDMFLENVEKGNYKGERFRKISDSAVIAELEKVREEMYGK
jgi:hypothetical protein